MLPLYSLNFIACLILLLRFFIDNVLLSSICMSKVKMMEMEEELSTLRKQIAMLVVAQETSSLSSTITGGRFVWVTGWESFTLWTTDEDQDK